MKKKIKQEDKFTYLSDEGLKIINKKIKVKK
jgi:hypothetical protein